MNERLGHPQGLGSNPNGEGQSFFSNLNDLFRSPRTIGELVMELRRLNDNLEGFQQAQQDLAILADAVADLREMLADQLGWDVVNKPTRKRD